MKNANISTAKSAKHTTKRMTVVTDSVANLRGAISDIDRIRVADVIIGAGYTGVSLSSGQIGLAHSLLGEQVPGCCEPMDKAGSLAGSRAFDLARLALSWDIRSRVVGIATLNALTQLALNSYGNRVVTRKGDITDHLTVRGDVVAVVGNIAPTIKKLRAKTRRVYVFERDLYLRDDNTLPDTAVEEILPQSDVVLITGTSIVNGTVDRLLELSRNAREVALVGATAGLPPTVLFRHGVTAVGTVRVTNRDRAMRVIAEGGGTPSLGSAIEFVVHKPLPKDR